METIKIDNSEFDIIDMSEITAGEFEKISSEIVDENGKAQSKIVPWLSILVKKWVKEGKEIELNKESIEKIKMSEVTEIMKRAGVVENTEGLDIFKKKIESGKEQK